jgi:hypothetical protein
MKRHFRYCILLIIFQKTLLVYIKSHVVFAVLTPVPGGMLPPLTPVTPCSPGCGGTGLGGLLHSLGQEGQIFVPRQMLLMARVREYFTFSFLVL